MTSRDRMKGLLAHDKSYDHYGIFEHFWGETLNDVWPSQGYPKDTDPAIFFDYDIRPIGGGPDATPFRLEKEDLIEETDEWKVTRSGWGAALKHWKHHSGVPEHIDFLIKTPADWKPYREQLIAGVDPARFDMEGIRKSLADGRRGDKFLVGTHLFLFETLRHALGDVTMLESFVLEPVWIHDIGRVLTDFYVSHWKMLFRELGKPDGMFIYEDLGFRNGLFASPKMLGDLIFPYYAELVDFYHSEGLPVILHSCGGITEAVPQLIDIGFDCIQPLEAKAGCDVIKLAEKFTDRVAFMGNIDVTILNTNDRARVNDHVVGLLERVWDLGGDYIFHSDHSVPPDIDFDTYRYAVDLFRDFCAKHTRNAR